MAKNITPRSENFPKWYQDVITAGELADNAPVRGCMVIRPVGFSLWESMQEKLDRMFKETGHENAYFPVLIPENFLEKEAEHVEGFSPEFAVVTHAGGKKLEENLIVRPTSETIIGHMYSKWIKSYRDLPILINQWVNVMRWEMRPRLFLRTSEFLWQEGHTVHETAAEAEEETVKILGIYKTFLQDICAIPVLTGLKPPHEKFPGADKTYTLEAMMQDKKALQSGTSHNLGQNFSKAFDIQFLDRHNQQAYGWTTSWGVSTRMIGGLIMTHADDDGIIIPPRLAPIKVVIVPIGNNAEIQSQTLKVAEQIQKSLGGKLGELSVKIDQRFDNRPGDRFFYWLQRGIPLRVELGPKDLQEKKVTLVRRDTKMKISLSIAQAAEEIPALLEQIQKDLFENALRLRNHSTYEVEDYKAFKKIALREGGFISAHWDGTKETAQKVQKETKYSIRVIPDDQIPQEGKCMVTGNSSAQRVIFATSY